MIRRYVPPGDSSSDASALGWFGTLVGIAGAASVPAYDVSPSAVLGPRDSLEAAFRLAASRSLPAATGQLYARLAGHQRTVLFRRLARHPDLDLLAARPGGAADSGAGWLRATSLSTSLTEAALANVAGALVAIQRHAFDSAAVRLGENASFAEQVLRAPEPRINQIGAPLLQHLALEPLAALAGLRGDPADAADLADAADRMEQAIPFASAWRASRWTRGTCSSSRPPS